MAVFFDTFHFRTNEMARNGLGSLQTCIPHISILFPEQCQIFFFFEELANVVPLPGLRNCMIFTIFYHFEHFMGPKKQFLGPKWIFFLSESFQDYSRDLTFAIFIHSQSLALPKNLKKEKDLAILLILSAFWQFFLVTIFFALTKWPKMA